MPFFGMILVIFICIYVLKNPSQSKDTTIKKDEESHKQETVMQPITPAPAQEINLEAPKNTRADYSKSYQAKYILTRNEWYEYKKLRTIADAKGLIICPKVRLLDLVEPRKGEGFMALLGKIQSKHVDFVIADKDLHVKAILELDDNSHNRPERQDRDNFIDEVLRSVGYKVIRTRSITEETLKDVIL